MLPLGIPRSTFEEMDKIISKFIWQGKRPRIKYKTLQRLKEDGGLNLPNLKYYFWAAQLKPLISWMQNDVHTRWLNIEQTMCSEALQALPFVDTSIKRLARWTKTTLDIWRKVRVAFKLPTSLSVLSSIGHIKSFTPINLDMGFLKWADHGLVYIHQLIDKDGLLSFEQLRRHSQLQKNDFFRYLQIRSFLISHKEWGKVLDPSPIENFLIQLQKREGVKNIITKLYKIFVSMTQNKPVQAKQRWEAEAAQTITDEMWREVCTVAHQTTNSNTWREFKWKIFSRYFRTPDIVAKMTPNVPSLCWRNCGTEVPNHTHIFWSCSKIQHFWDEVYKAINQIFQVIIPRDLTVAVLGITPPGMHGRTTAYLLNILFTAALKCITISWMKTESPSFSAWIQKVKELYQMEKITYLLRLQLHIFRSRWSPAESLLM